MQPTYNLITRSSDLGERGEALVDRDPLLELLPLGARLLDLLRTRQIDCGSGGRGCGYWRCSGAGPGAIGGGEPSTAGEATQVEKEVGTAERGPARG